MHIINYWKKQTRTLRISKNKCYKRWRHEIRHRGPPVKIAPGPLPFNPTLRGPVLLLLSGPGLRFATLLLQYPSPESASHLKSTTRDVNFLRSDSRCRRCVSSLSNVVPRYLGPEQKYMVLLLWLTFSSRLASLLLRWKAADTDFVARSFGFQVW